LKINTTHYYNTLASSVPGIGNGFVKSVNWTEEKSSFFVAILNENLEFYLDEIIDAYFKQTKILLHPSTIWRKLVKQGYRLKIYSERAKQQNEADRAAYTKALVFIDWLTLKVLPLLGNFAKGEPRNIFILDNASIHMDKEIASLIQRKGAYILYTAEFSPDINPIEKMIVIYKACVKRNQALLASNSWYDLHFFALGTVTPDIALSKFKKCGFPIKDLKTVKEKQEHSSNGYYFDHGDCCYYY
jgi:transposase